MEEPQEEVEQQNPAKRDKREAVEATDKEGSEHVSDDALDPPDETSAPLIADVSADVSPMVEEFMDQAAQQNEAAAEAVPDRKNKPGPYISFEHVYKSFDDFVVLEDVSFSILPGETLCILGRSGVGKSVSLQILMGFLRAGPGPGDGGGRRHLRDERAGTAADSPESDDGVSEWRAVRLDFGG